MNMWTWYRRSALQPLLLGWLLAQGYAVADGLVNGNGWSALVYSLTVSSLFASAICFGLLILCLPLLLNKFVFVHSRKWLSALCWMALPMVAMTWSCGTELYTVATAARYHWWQALPSFLISGPLAIGLWKGWKRFRKAQPVDHSK